MGGLRFMLGMEDIGLRLRGRRLESLRSMGYAVHQMRGGEAGSLRSMSYAVHQTRGGGGWKASVPWATQCIRRAGAEAGKPPFHGLRSASVAREGEAGSLLSMFLSDRPVGVEGEAEGAGAVAGDEPGRLAAAAVQPYAVA